MTNIKIDIKIMSILARSKSAERLKAKIGGEIIYDDRGIYGGGDAWYNAKRCWCAPAENGVTHRLVIQDDAIVCDNFLSRVSDCLSFNPNAIWAFYLQPNLQRELITSSATPYMKIWGAAICGIAVIIPLYIDYHDVINETDIIFGADYKHDDNRLAWYINSHGIDCYSTYPALVSHSVEMKSASKHNSKRFNILFDKKCEANWDSTDEISSKIFFPYFWLKNDSPYYVRAKRYIDNAKRGERARYAESIKEKAKPEARR